MKQVQVHETSATSPDGLHGSTYGICTTDTQQQPLPLQRIQEHVSEFLYEAEERPQLEFLVTRIGCGLAGYTDEQIAPMFRHAPVNVKLPEAWVKLLDSNKKPRNSGDVSEKTKES